MPPLSEEPIMLAMFVLIALGLGFYIYIIIFQAKFGRGHDKPEEYGERYPLYIKLFLLTILGLALVAVLIISFLPMTFTVKYNETYTIETESAPLHYSSVFHGYESVYAFRINIQGKPGSRISINITADECVITGRLFSRLDYPTWLTGSIPEPYKLTVTQPGSSDEYDYLPSDSGDFLLVIDGECIPQERPRISLTHFWDVSINKTRIVTKQVNRTLLQRWLTR
jgi:hypothetical protein